MFDPLDIVGVKYKNIEVVSYLPKHRDSGHYYKCVCQDCGREHTKIRIYVIQESGCKSCTKKGSYKGASSKPLNKKVSSKSCNPEYGAWNAMKRRCYKEDNPSYENYGARGIEVCNEWINSFENFYRDMGPRPSRE